MGQFLAVGLGSSERTYDSPDKQGPAEGFTKRYGVKTLVYYELHESSEAAILREKQIKKWERAWKIRLIERDNPNWDDLYDKIVR